MNQGRQTMEQMLGRHPQQQQYMAAFDENEEKTVRYLINSLLYRVTRLEKKVKRQKKRLKELRSKAASKKRSK